MAKQMTTVSEVSWRLRGTRLVLPSSSPKSPQHCGPSGLWALANEKGVSPWSVRFLLCNASPSSDEHVSGNESALSNYFCLW